MQDLTPDELKLIIDFLKKRLSKVSESDPSIENVYVRACVCSCVRVYILKAKEGDHAFSMEMVGQVCTVGGGGVGGWGQRVTKRS